MKKCLLFLVLINLLLILQPSINMMPMEPDTPTTQLPVTLPQLPVAPQQQPTTQSPVAQVPQITYVAPQPQLPITQTPKTSYPVSSQKKQRSLSTNQPRSTKQLMKQAPATLPIAQKQTMPVQQAPVIQAQQKPVTPVVLSRFMPLPQSTNYAQKISICAYNISLLNTKPSKEEIAKIKQLLTKNIPELYNQRANKTMQEITALSNLFQITSKNKELSSLATKNQIETVKALEQISATFNQPDITQKIHSLPLVLKNLTKNIAPYEKQLFIDGITNIFNMREKLIQTNLILFHTFCSSLADETMRQKKIFDNKTYNTFEEFAKVSQCTQIIITPPPQKTFKDLINSYQSVVPSLSYASAITERKFFADKTIVALYRHEGNLKSNDIKTLITFFNNVLKTPNVLAANQISEMTSRIYELEIALKLATPTKTYLEALIDQITATKSIDTCNKALTLFTEHTENKVRKTFIIAINTLYTQRNTIDKPSFLAFLKDLGKKKLGEVTPFLSDAQKTKLNEWINSLS